MKTSGSKKGSALLVVLGMLSFMVVSAVAFSAYMRTSRLPSSYLRRVVASRMLAKAALSEAIDEIDAAVGNFPHPGVWMQRDPSGTGLSSAENLHTRLTRTTRNTKAGHNSNAWLGRVYIGGSNDVSSVQERVRGIPQQETVSTLTLESLAYIPPPLVNEARYYARHSNAGKWHMLPFDAGRYAFCAIDVSDFFDVNALTADMPRSSGSSSRISLAYLFENETHTTSGGGASGWDSFIASTLSGNVPLVSMADWNLALGSMVLGDVKSYFYKYVTSDATSFYCGEGSSDQSAEKIRRMSFVTDGWFPSEPPTGDMLDLSDPANQPFSVSELSNPNPNYYQITESGSAGATKMRKHLPNMTLAMLYDYLDEDRVPVSLAMPSVERVPMICGLEPLLTGSNVQLKKWRNGSEDENAPDDYPDGEKPAATTRRARRTIMFCLDPAALFGGMPSVKALVTYPFRHKDGENVTFTLDGGLAFFFTTEQMGLRPRGAVPGLRFTAPDKFASASITDGVILLPFDSKPSVTFQQVNNVNDAVREVTVMANPAGVASQLMTDGFSVLRVVYEWTQTDQSDRENGAQPWSGAVDKPDPTDENVIEAVCNLRPLTANGSVDGAFTGTGPGLINAIAGKKMQLNVAVYARILDQNGKTVDLVPAAVESDTINGSSNNSMPESQVLLGDNCGAATPLMRFNSGGSGDANTGSGFECSIAGMTAAKTPQNVTLFPGAAMVGDPRFNYAPESWFGVATPGISANSWLTDNGAAGDPANIANRRDGDIFMASSDQNYLQSVYELANLPRIARRGFFANSGGNEVGNLQSPNVFAPTTFLMDKNDPGIVNREFMWRTYDPFMRYENDDVTFEDLQIVNYGNGFKISPYSDSTNVMMAAFANTPHDWRCSSTNEQTNAQIVNMNCDQFNRQHAWNEYSSAAKLSWDDLNLVAETFMDEMSDAKGDDWEDVWRDLPWFSETRVGDEASKYIFDEALVDTSDQGRLYNTDKQFLYGFWHDCFDVRQQLFLVFVRAEPLLMGGGAVHQQPPQLGARAVALVWRDPKNRSTDTSKAYPHRTRILFYRQFD